MPTIILFAYDIKVKVFGVRYLGSNLDSNTHFCHVLLIQMWVDYSALQSLSSLSVI